MKSVPMKRPARPAGKKSTAKPTPLKAVTKPPMPKKKGG